jgi:hypothetical protein
MVLLILEGNIAEFFAVRRRSRIGTTLAKALAVIAGHVHDPECFVNPIEAVEDDARSVGREMGIVLTDEVGWSQFHDLAAIEVR